MVDTVLIPVKYSKDVVMPKSIIAKLPQTLMLFAAVQFIHLLKDVESQLHAEGKKTVYQSSKNYLYEGMITPPGQLLGCNMEHYEAKGIEFDAFLYIGDGLFHPKALLVNNKKDVYCYDPKTHSLNVLEAKLHDTYEKHKNGAKVKFLMSKNIGILITTKVGQASPKRAEKLRQNIKNKWPEKNIYVFFASEISFSDLENYNFVDIYVNVACSRIGHDDSIRSEKPLINIADVESLLKDA